MLEESSLGLLGIFFFISLIIFVLSRVGGWKRLADVFPEKPFVAGKRWSWQSLRFNSWCGYNNIVTVIANGEGLRFSLPFLFRIGHAPLFIPWKEMKIREEPILFGLTTAFRLEFPKCPTCHVTISRWLFAELERSAFPVKECLDRLPEEGNG